MHFLSDYGLFAAKVTTLVIAILVVIAAVMAMVAKAKTKAKGRFEIKKLNDKYKAMKNALCEATLNKAELKKHIKQSKKETKKASKQAKAKGKKVFVIRFHGDIRATAVKNLREEITAVLTVAKPSDEVVVCLESAGGMVHAYGLAASQLVRLRQANIPVTAVIDKVAASGGYMIACVANKILAAPFAVIGSIGVIAQLPNLHRWLKKHNIDYEQIMAGEYKRTLTVFGENTRKERQKFQQEIDDTHELFKQFVSEHRPIVDIKQVATGEHWFGKRAIERKLVDDLQTSDDYLMKASEQHDIYEVKFITRSTLASRFAHSASSLLQKISHNWQQQDQEARLL